MPILGANRYNIIHTYHSWYSRGCDVNLIVCVILVVHLFFFFFCKIFFDYLSKLLHSVEKLLILNYYFTKTRKWCFIVATFPVLIGTYPPAS